MFLNIKDYIIKITNENIVTVSDKQLASKFNKDDTSGLLYRINSKNIKDNNSLHNLILYLEKHNTEIYELPNLSENSKSFSIKIPYQNSLRIHCYHTDSFRNKVKVSNIFYSLIDNIKKTGIKNYIIFLKEIDNIEDKRNAFRYINPIELNSKIEFVNTIWKKGLPFEFYNEKNKLNNLTGREWIKFTKTWEIIKPPPRSNKGKIHPAKYPEIIIKDFIRFFTKKGDLVIDPFVGVGSTIIASYQLGRNSIGLEINEKYANIAKKRIEHFIDNNIVENTKQNVSFMSYTKIKDFKFNKIIQHSKYHNNFYQKYGKYIFPFEVFENQEEIYSKQLLYKRIINENSKNILEVWKNNKFPKADFCITSPPYWNQLKNTSLRQKKRKEEGLDTKYSSSLEDIGNIEDYHHFLQQQKEIFYEVNRVLKKNAYIIIITNNVYTNSKLYPLAFDTLTSLSEIWVPKDEKIWCQNDKALIPLGVNSAWVGNRCHQYCLIFRKE